MALLRLDGAPLPSILLATNKAWTAARERKTTRDIGQAVRDPVRGFDITYFGDPRYIGWGGVPVVRGTQVTGAVAVSGLSEEEDEELARMGIEAINESNNCSGRFLPDLLKKSFEVRSVQEDTPNGPHDQWQPTRAAQLMPGVLVPRLPR